MAKKKITSLKVIIADPDIERRVRVREALRDVSKLENYDARTLSEVQSLLTEVGNFDLFILSSAFGTDELRRVLSNLAHSPTMSSMPVVILLRPEARVAPFVAEMYARGILGFICEPFSVNDVSEILALIEEGKRGNIDQRSKDRLATSFLLTDALKHFEKIVEFRLEGKKGDGFIGRDFRDDCSAMHQTAANLTPEELSALLEKRFASSEPRQLSEAELKRMSKPKKKKLAPALHPGEELRLLIDSRGISKERVLEIAKIPPNEFDEILASKRDLTEVSAEGVARAVGRSKQYWFALQKKYEAYQEQLREEQGEHPSPGRSPPKAS